MIKIKEMDKIWSICGVALYVIFFSNRLVAQVVAFPGAEGYGRYATGGRTVSSNRPSAVAIVTNLEDDADTPPEGSFRWALQQGKITVTDPILGSFTSTVPLTIVFQVGGVINLKADIHTSRSNLTIAGQTALGDGICFRGYTVNLSGSSNVIIRYLRFRPGDESDTEISSLRIENGENFIIDHCSMSWAIEENTHFSSNDNTTVQWCIVSESLFNSIHKKGERGYAAQWGGEFASYHHNLLAHHHSRMPRVNGSNENDVYALVDYRNNVNYNWENSGAMYGGEFEGTPNCTGYSHVNVVNNYFIPGPASEGNIFAAPLTNRGGVTLCGYAKWFVNGNVMVGDEDMTKNNWLGINFGYKDSIYSSTEFVESDGVLEAYSEYSQSAADAYISVLADAGATLPKRDAHDTRVIAELKGEKSIVRYSYTSEAGVASPVDGVNSGIIDTQNNLVSAEDREQGIDAWSVYSTVLSDQAPTDTDLDGMPDSWEVANGLDPNDYSDHRTIGESGYSNLEVYLAGLTGVKVAAKQIEMPKLNIYPNPTDGVVLIESEKELVDISVFNLAGEQLICQSLSEKSTTLDITGIEPGFYIVEIRTKDGNCFTKKIIKR